MGNILLFLGSGVSLKSGMPETEKITELILNGRWFKHSNDIYYSGKHPNPEPIYQDSNIVPRLQAYLKEIKKDFDSYVERKRSFQSNYEDLFYISSQIYDELTGEIDNSAIVPYIENLDKRCQNLYKPIPFNPTIHVDLKFLSEEACKLIQDAVWHLLDKENSILGFDLLNEIIKCEQFSKIFIATLNHDLLLERYLDSLGVKYTDGFDQLNGEVRPYNSNVYENDEIKIHLVKLHGSVNWFTFRLEKEGTYTDFYAIPQKFPVELLKDSEGNLLTNLLGRPYILAGTYNKVIKYMFGIIRSQHSLFEKMLENTTVLIMSGYGWNDKGINAKLFDWINYSLKNRLILLYQNPERLQESKSSLWYNYKYLVKEGRLIPMNKWFCDTKLEDIIEF